MPCTKCSLAFRVIDTDSTLSFSVASPGAWWSTERALWTRSSRVLAEPAEALGSIGYNSTVDVDDGSTVGTRDEAL